MQPASSEGNYIMTQHVFDNGMVAHVWAQRSQSSGRSHNGNFSFKNNTLYSYSTPIAKFIRDERGNHRATLVTSHRYSMTTSGKHMPVLWRAINYGRGDFAPCFTVPNVSPVGRNEHEANLVYLVACYTDIAPAAKRVRDIYFNIEERLTARAKEACHYARSFDLPQPELDPASDAAAILAHREVLRAKRETPAYLRKQEAAKRAREAKKAREKALCSADAAKRLVAWRSGELSSLGRNDPRQDEAGGAYLRIKGDQLQTSLGASVPLDHAIRVYRAVKRCRDAGQGWTRNGETMRVGHFQINEIEPSGDFKAGCHRINWPEIERAAIAAGVA
jgi:hypothetical protein